MLADMSSGGSTVMEWRRRGLRERWYEDRDDERRRCVTDRILDERDLERCQESRDPRDVERRRNGGRLWRGAPRDPPDEERIRFRERVEDCRQAIEEIMQNHGLA